MNIEFMEKKENKLLGRTEVHFKVIHEGEKTPERELVKNELADLLKVKKGNIILEYLKPEFGIQQSTGYAKVYKSAENVKKIEKEHILKRNKFGAEKKEETKEEIEKASEQKKEEQTGKPEEKKDEKVKEEEKVEEGEKDDKEQSV